MKSAPFEYVSATSIEHAVRTVHELGEDTKFIAGGQSLVPLMALRLARPAALVDLGEIAAMRYVRQDSTLRIGSLTTHAALARDVSVQSTWPLISEAAVLIGHAAVRNRGTIGGSLAHADPAAELPVLALILDAVIEVVGEKGARTIPADAFFVSYFTTSLAEDEVITEVRLPIPPKDVGTAFIEVARRQGDFGIAGAAAVIRLSGGRAQDVRLGLMGVAETPIRIPEAEDVLRDSALTSELVETVVDIVGRSIDPPSDIHATSDFRRNTAAILAARAIREAWTRAGERDES